MTVMADSMTPVDRLQAALGDPDHLFTREQVVYLMAEAARWARESVEGESSPETYAAGFADGYRARVDDENATYPPPPLLIGGRWIDQVDYRRKCDAEARRRRPGDYRGGKVRTWASTWCGQTDAGEVPVPHRPHVHEHVEHDATGAVSYRERFRCEGRRG